MGKYSNYDVATSNGDSEKALWCAVLLTCVQDLTVPSKTGWFSWLNPLYSTNVTAFSNYVNTARIINWLQSNDCNLVCEYAGVDQAVFAKMIRTKIKNLFDSMPKATRAKLQRKVYFPRTPNDHIARELIPFLQVVQ